MRQFTTLFIIFVIVSGFSHPSIAQRTVTGTVTEAASDFPLPGVSIQIKGTNEGTATDPLGKYSISVSDDATLVFSFIGFESQEIVVGNKSVIDVKLSDNVKQLSEIVVVGYGAVEKGDVTGAVASVGEAEFNNGVITSPERLLAGKVAGVNITSNGGEPGGGSAIRIRGGTSLDASSDPLIVIDGVPVDNGGVAGGRNPLNFVNPADIKEITVLKDASAGAIYGARAANGVIIITTKSGEPGKLKVNYNAFFSVSHFLQEPDILSTENFRKAVNLKAPQNLRDLGESDTDWVRESLQTATGLQQMVSVSGGSENHRIYASANYLDNRGVIRTSRNQNTNLSFRYNGNLLNDNLIVTANMKGGLFQERFAPNVLGAAQAFDPTQPIFSDDPTFGGYFEWANPLAVGNPVATIDLTENFGESSRLLGNLDLEYKLPVEGLSFKANLGYDTRNGVSENLVSPFLKGAQPNGGYYGLFTTNKESKLMELYSIYKKELTDSKFDVTFGYSYQEFITESDGIQFNELPDGFSRGQYEATPEVLGPNSPIIDQANLLEDVLYDRPRNLLISYFGRLNYQLKDKYLLTVNLRRDGSSKFGPRNRWAFFPSFAFGWRLLDEDFAQNWRNTFSDLKLRIGWGVTGNQEIGDFRFLSTYTFSRPDAYYQFGDTYIPMLRPDPSSPDIKWEETSSLNIGLDFGFADGRVNGSVQYYDKLTSDLLFRIAMPAGSLPFDRAITNIGEMRNNGVEVLLNNVIVDREEFSYDLSFNIALNKNRILKLDNSNLPDFEGYETGGIAGDVGQTIQILKVGETRSAFRTYKQKYNSDGSPIFGTPIEMYEDISGDGIINQDDRVVGKTPDPIATMGTTSVFRYKKFDGSFTFRASFGNWVYNNVASATGHFQRLDDLGIVNNIHESAFDTNFEIKQLFSDYYLENGSFLKLDNITVGYNGSFLKNKRFRAYTTLQNVFMLTGYSGLDPEVFGGIDNNIYPRALTVIFGVNANF